MSEPTVTPEGVEVLQHALGLSQEAPGVDPLARPMTRNYFCAHGGDRDAAVCEALADAGLFVRGGFCNEGADRFYHATDAGRAAALAALPPPPRLTRSQRRYRAFLRADSGLSFGEWLRAQKERRAG